MIGWLSAYAAICVKPCHTTAASRSTQASCVTPANLLFATVVAPWGALRSANMPSESTAPIR